MSGMNFDRAMRPRRLPGALKLCCAVAAIAPAPLLADTLQGALRAAYESNPTLMAQRGAVRATDESVPIARAAGLPTVEGTATYEENILKGKATPGGFVSNPDRQLVSQLSANVPLLTFGAVGSAVRAAEARAESSRAGLRSTESDLFTSVVGAYMDVIRDEAIVRLNERNTGVLTYTLTETRERLRAGERPSSDVDQAEAREALAQSQLETAKARLISSREAYVRLVGHEPGSLDPPQPLPPLPASPEVAVSVAMDNNPKLLIARAERRASDHDVTVAGAAGLPRLSAIGNLNQYDYLNSLAPGTGPRNRDQGVTASVGVQLKLPIYNGGGIAAQTRQAREKQGVAIEKVIEAERLAIAETRSAYSTWRASEMVIGTARRGVAANVRALESIKAQTDVGMRPLIDRLNAEQELLNAQVTTVTAQRDAYVAGFALLAAMGKAEAKDLNLDGTVLYDPIVHYDHVHGANAPFSGTGSEPQPIARSTRDVPAQTDKVVTPLGMTEPR